MLALAALAMTLVLPLLSPIRSSVTTGGALSGVVVSNSAVWGNGYLMLPLVSPGRPDRRAVYAEHGPRHLCGVEREMAEHRTLRA